MTSMRTLLAAAVFGALLSSTASAAPCAGFTDVDSADPFCVNVEWIRNRYVTLGCNSTTVYCPTELVFRDSMALFLRRLGNALSGRLEFNSSNPPLTFLILDNNPQTNLCETPRNFASTFPMRARVYAIVDASGQAGSADIFVRVRESADNGVTWVDASPMHKATISDGFESRVTLRAMTAPRDIAAGTQYKYTVAIGRVPGSATTGNLNQVRCSIHFTYGNRNSATAPLDDAD